MMLSLPPPCKASSTLFTGSSSVRGFLTGASTSFGDAVPATYPASAKASLLSKGDAVEEATVVLPPVVVVVVVAATTTFGPPSMTSGLLVVWKPSPKGFAGVLACSSIAVAVVEGALVVGVLDSVGAGLCTEFGLLADGSDGVVTPTLSRWSLPERSTEAVVVSTGSDVVAVGLMPIAVTVTTTSSGVVEVPADCCCVVVVGVNVVIGRRAVVASDEI